MKPSSHSIAVLIATTSLAALAACNRSHGDTTGENVALAQTTGAQTGGATHTTGATTAGQNAKTQPAQNDQKTALPAVQEKFELNMAGRAPQTLDYQMMGDKIRLSMFPKGQKAKGIDAIINADTHEAYLLMPQKKQYTKVDLDQYGQQAKQALANVKVDKTGQKKTIEGRQCEMWKLTDSGYLVDACVAQGGPKIDVNALQANANFTAPPWVHQIVSQGYVPVQVTVTDQSSGKVIGTSHLTKMDRNVQASAFEIPKGYKEVPLSQVGQGQQQQAPATGKAKTAPQTKPSNGTQGGSQGNEGMTK